VALGASDREVFSFKRILRLAMIEIDRIDGVPSHGAVAGTAILSKLSGMRISMAGSTIAERDAFVAHVIEICFGWTVGHQLMTLQTCYRLVSAGEGEFGDCMIKSQGRFPGGLVVAGCAVLSKVAAMFIAMAVAAIGLQSEKGPARVELFVFCELKSGDELRTVAFAAIQTGMFFFEDESGQCMVESLLAIFPMDQIKISPLMLDVAILTVTIIRQAMQAFAGFALGLDTSVALQTVVRHQFLIATVTFGAILHAFEGSMNSMQITGRQLRIGDTEEEKQECERKERSYHTQPYPVQMATPICTNMIRYMMIANGLWMTCQ
jgi:hypothetical protein